MFFVQITKSASLPSLIEPKRLSKPKILAGLIVMALIASYSGRPALAAKEQHLKKGIVEALQESL
jgi:hypothetical protein